MTGLEAQLRKPEMIAGESVLLGNGERWTIPCVPFLPKAVLFTPGEDGAVAFSEKTTHPKYLKMCEALVSLLDDVYAQGEASIIEMPAKSYETAYQLLAINYNITPDVVNACGLFTETNILPLLVAALGQKKTSSFAESAP